MPKHEIGLPKIAILCCFSPKPYLKTPNARKFLDQNGCWVEIIQGKERFENFRCGAALVTKIVKTPSKNILNCNQKKPLKTPKYENWLCCYWMAKSMLFLFKKKHNQTLQWRSYCQNLQQNVSYFFFKSGKKITINKNYYLNIKYFWHSIKKIVMLISVVLHGISLT